MSAQIRLEMRLPFLIVKKEKWYVSSCPILDVFSQGATEQDAKKNLIEALTLFLTSCFEHGTLEAVLKQCGFQRAIGGPFIPPKSEYKDYVDIPLHLLSSESGQNQCHA